VEKGIAAGGARPAEGRRLASHYFDLALLMDYWSERRLNHHTEAGTMLYGARECARLVVEEGLDARIARHALHGDAMVCGLEAMGLGLFGDQAHKMANVVGIEIPAGIDGERVRTAMREEFEIEIGTSFGPLAGRIWRIGTMGYNCRKDAVLSTLGALEAVLRGEGAKVRSGAAVDAARARYAER
jgi:(S)-ureidoglycine-glyoxylate aminotransferase